MIFGDEISQTNAGDNVPQMLVGDYVPAKLVGDCSTCRHVGVEACLKLVGVAVSQKLVGDDGPYYRVKVMQVLAIPSFAVPSCRDDVLISREMEGISYRMQLETVSLILLALPREIISIRSQL